MAEEQRCRICGAVRDSTDPAAITWTSERDGEEVRLLCPDCTRRHARDIESGLPAEYW